MESKSNFFLVALGAFGTLVATMFLWRMPMWLVVSLLCINAGLLLFLNRRRFIAVYVFGFLFGPLTEIAAIYTGAWQYTAPIFFGIPLWLPFVWGSASLVIASAYEAFARHETKQ